MTTHKQNLILLAVLMGSALLACNLTGSAPNAVTSPPATMTPPYTPEFQLEDPIETSNYFLEDFQEGLPESWLASTGWVVSAGTLATSVPSTSLDIPGVWQDMGLFLRLKPGSGGAALEFNITDSGAYRLTLQRNEVALDWLPQEGGNERLASAELDLSPGWHDLEVSQVHGLVAVLLDGQTLFSGLNPAYSPAGSLRLSKLDSGTLEIDRIVIAPPNR